MLKRLLLVLITLILIFPVAGNFNGFFMSLQRKKGHKISRSHTRKSTSKRGSKRSGKSRTKTKKGKKSRVVRRENVTVYAPPVVLNDSTFIPSNLPEKQWIDSVFATMNLDQKIGQFFMVAAYSNRGEDHFRKIESLIQNNNIGGIIFFKGEPATQVNLTNNFQAMAKIPLLIGIDGEWGLGMRLDAAMSFPKQMTLGAVQNNQLIYRMGAEIARQCKRVGIHLNFAPVVDINSNPNNPVIGHRSFGELRDNVAEKSVAYMRGMQNNQLLACAKHFPGHGDTHVDSHHTLPQVSYNLERLKSVELYPFQKLIEDSLQTLIVGHLQVPYLDWKPATLSQNIVTNLLKNEMGFKGLVITDALNMRGVSNGLSSAEVDLQAFLAGNDILLYSEDISGGIQKIKQAVEQGTIPQSEIDERVRKILRAKFWTGLSRQSTIDTRNLSQELNTDEARQIKQELFENAVTIVRNEGNLLPLKSTKSADYLAVSIDAGVNNSFHQALNKFVNCQQFTNISRSDEAFFNEVLGAADSTKTIILSIHDAKNRPAGRFGISASIQDFVKKLEKKTKVILCVFGSPYSLKYFPESSIVVCGYEDDVYAQEAVAQVLFGALPAIGKLPVSVEGLYKAGDGIMTSSLNRLGFALPEATGMSSKGLLKIDFLINNAIENRVFPGCQVLIARKGKVIYQKNFGRLSYDNYDRVLDNTVYDLASVTKVTATLQAVMALYDQKAIDLNQKASFYLPELKGTNKEGLIIKDILFHQAGLVAYIPFWEKTVDQNNWKTEYYNASKTAEYPLEVREGMYAKASIRDSVWKWVIKSPLSTKKDRDGNFSYVYSDLGLIILHHVVEKLLVMPLDEFVQKSFYSEIGMNSTYFNPLQNGIAKVRIAPTENDVLFRNAQLQGTVQDQTAAMLGGVSGHAGLFSTAHDLAKLMLMNLGKGSYGATQFLSEETLNYFTKTTSVRSHRALGWDKLPADGESNYVSSKVSASSFGHSGYTGTLVWVDPQKDLIFVFLANRVYPSASNNKINQLKIRRRIMDLIYEAMK